jgi:1-acyl-sn-glycerol-3-phosphate acyltransferase
MSRRDIKKFSWGYAIVRFFGSIYHRLYYRKLVLKFREKIPVNKPVIFALNHQNALMDALAIVFTDPSQVIFMARADIFRKKKIASILYFLKILPAYRIRDGFHSVDQNKEVFKEVIDALEFKRPVAILPEGNHYGEKRLRSLKKGAARLALLSEEANGFKMGISIVPVGIDYSNYYNAGSDLLVVFGDPIPAAVYREQYLENPAQAIKSYTDELASAMKKVMLDIEPEEHYRTFYDAIEIYSPVELKKQNLRSTLWNSFRIKKQLSEKLKENPGEKSTEIKSLQEAIKVYKANLAKNRIRDCQVTNKHANPFSLFFASIFSLILIPVHIYGMVLNYLPYGLPIYLARKIKDMHFLSSVRFVYGLMFFFIWYLLLIASSFIIFSNIFISLAFIASLPLTGLFSFYYYRHLLKIKADFRWMSMKFRQRKVYEEMVNARKEIVFKIEGLLKA